MIKAEAELASTAETQVSTAADVFDVIEALGEIGQALSKADPGNLARVYAALRVQVWYEPEARAAEVTIQPVTRVNSVRVRGGLRHDSVAILPRFGGSCDGR